MKKLSQQLLPLLLCPLLMLPLSSCGLANAAVNAPGTLFKGMSGAVARSLNMSADNTPMEKPVIDHDALQPYRDQLENTPDLTPTNHIPSLAHTSETTPPVL